MLIKQDLINRIRDYFSLNVYEVKVWMALLSKGIASAGEIATLSGVPRSRTYDVLEGLEKRGFVIIKLEKPVKYIGVKPHVILEKLKNNVHEEARERTQSLSKIKETDEYEQLLSLYNSGMDPVKREDISASLKGRSNITNYLKEVLQNAEKEVIICMNASEINSKAKLFKQTIDELKKKGVKVKVALSGDDELVKEVAKKLDVKVKKVDIEAKFFLVDRDEILFYISKNEGSASDEIAIWLNSDFFGEAFASLFDKAMAGGK